MARRATCPPFESCGRARALSTLRFLLPRDQRGKIAEVDRQRERIIAVVDAFYETLGPRYWLYDERLPLTELEAIAGLGVDEAERRLIALYRDPVLPGRRILGLCARPGVREPPRSLGTRSC